MKEAYRRTISGLRFGHGSPLTCGVWLLATPDYDGGRQAVGGMIVAAAGLVIVFFGIVYALARPRRRTPRPL
jgi:hypothetical protein